MCLCVCVCDVAHQTLQTVDELMTEFHHIEKGGKSDDVAAILEGQKVHVHKHSNKDVPSKKKKSKRSRK